MKLESEPRLGRSNSFLDIAYLVLEMVRSAALFWQKMVNPTSLSNYKISFSSLSACMCVRSCMRIACTHTHTHTCTYTKYLHVHVLKNAYATGKIFLTEDVQHFK